MLSLGGGLISGGGGGGSNFWSSLISGVVIKKCGSTVWDRTGELFMLGHVSEQITNC